MYQSAFFREAIGCVWREREREREREKEREREVEIYYKIGSYSYGV